MPYSFHNKISAFLQENKTKSTEKIFFENFLKRAFVRLTFFV